MRFFRPFTPLLVGWLVSFAVWGTIAALIGSEAVGRGFDLWSVAVKNGIRDWAPWAIVTPLLFRLVARLPLERHRWFLVWPAHLLICALTLSAINGWKSLTDWTAVRFFHAPPAPDFGSFPPPPPQQGEKPSLPRDLSSRPPGFSNFPPRLDLLHYFTFELPIYFLLIAIAQVALYRRRLDERAASLARARLEALRSQLQPHFLFNTLNTIAGLVHEQPDKADTMLVALSDLLRLSLETSSETEITLRHELDYVERYLAIMMARFQDRIGYVIDASPDARNGLVPAFILQPLVENAVQHGLQPRAEGGIVTVRATRCDANLRITVSDDGVGFRHRDDATEGIGIGNARARLAELYGARASLEMFDGPQTEVVIELPYHEAP